MGADTGLSLLQKVGGAAPKTAPKGPPFPRDIFEKMKLGLAAPHVGHVRGEDGLEQYVG